MTENPFELMFSTIHFSHVRQPTVQGKPLVLLKV